MSKSDNLFFEDFFTDTEQTEVVTYVADLGLYFVLRLNGLSYSYSVLGSDLALIQWRFTGGKLIIEDSNGVYQVAKVNDDESGLLVNVVRGQNKKVIFRKKCFLNVLHEVESSDIEEFGTWQSKAHLSAFQKLLHSILNKDTAKQLAVPIIVIVVGTFVLFNA
ncbi:hypothetical protein QTV49_000310 [Vibrio vulnificus]|nr:hypothetical protein [Vibrio vulnificus]